MENDLNENNGWIENANVRRQQSTETARRNDLPLPDIDEPDILSLLYRYIQSERDKKAALFALLLSIASKNWKTSEPTWIPIPESERIYIRNR